MGEQAVIGLRGENNCYQHRHTSAPPVPPQGGAFPILLLERGFSFVRAKSAVTDDDTIYKLAAPATRLRYSVPERNLYCRAWHFSDGSKLAALSILAFFLRTDSKSRGPKQRRVSPVDLARYHRFHAS